MTVSKAKKQEHEKINELLKTAHAHNWMNRLKAIEVTHEYGHMVETTRVELDTKPQ